MVATTSGARGSGRSSSVWEPPYQAATGTGATAARIRGTSSRTTSRRGVAMRARPPAPTTAAAAWRRISVFPAPHAAHKSISRGPSEAVAQRVRWWATASWAGVRGKGNRGQG